MPPAVVLATDVFDRFLSENDLLDFAIQLRRRCRDRAPVPGSIVSGQRAQQPARHFCLKSRYPLAVRSSSLLEDSQYQPFTGVYETFMLANHHPDLFGRGCDSCIEAIKRVYASTFSQHAKAYVRATPYRLEEEKMAVILQQVVGSAAWPRVSIPISPASCARTTSIPCRP